MQLRETILDLGYEETYKWSFPVYTWQDKNIIGLGRTKNYAAIWFFHGNLLSDNHGMLINAQEGKTKGMRHWRFEHIDELDEALVRLYLEEAKDQVTNIPEKRPRIKPLIIPTLLRDVLDTDRSVKKSFDSMGRTKQREYCEYILEAKQMETKERRLASVVQLIKSGSGLNDKYRASKK